MLDSRGNVDYTVTNRGRGWPKRMVIGASPLRLLPNPTHSGNSHRHGHSREALFVFLTELPRQNVAGPTTTGRPRLTAPIIRMRPKLRLVSVSPRRRLELLRP